MKKRLFAAMLASLMLTCLLAPAALAEETEALETVEAEDVPHATSGVCGDDISWVLEGNTLRVTGSGKMRDGCSWEYYKDKIKKVVFSGDISYIGAKAFLECENLVSIDFGNALHTIGASAFQGCTALETIHLPESFRKFEANAFRDCTALESVYCDGPMPSFRDGSLWTGTHVAIYTPLNNPWPMESAQELMRNYGGRLEIIPGGAGEQYVEPEVEEPTEAPTQAPTEPETVPPTEPPQVVEPLPPIVFPTVTEPVVTEAPTAEPTQAPTEVPTEPVLSWLEPTEEKELDVVEEVSNNGWIGMVIVAGVFTFLIVGALIFRSASRKGGKYTE